MKKLFSILMVVCIHTTIFAQTYYLQNKNTGEHNLPTCFYNDTLHHCFLFASKHEDYSSNLAYTKLFKTDYQGNILDTSVVSNVLDSAIIFHHISLINDSEYVVIGRTILPNYFVAGKLYYQKIGLDLSVKTSKFFYIDTNQYVYDIRVQESERKTIQIMGSIASITGTVTQPIAFKGKGFINEIDVDANSIKTSYLYDSLDKQGIISSLFKREDSLGYISAIYNAQVGWPISNILYLDTNYNFIRGVRYKTLHAWPQPTIDFDKNFIYPLGKTHFIEARPDNYNGKPRCFILKHTNSLQYINYVSLPESDDTTDDNAQRNGVFNPVAINEQLDIYALKSNKYPDFITTFIRDNYVQVCKLDSNLNVKWQRSIGGDTYYEALSIFTLKNNGCMVLAVDYYNPTPSTSQVDMIIFSLDSTGVLTGFSSFDNPTKNIVQIYPNPTKNSINCLVTNNLLQSTLTLYDIFGKAVHSETIKSNETSIDISNFPVGNYIYEIIKEGKRITGKIQKR